MRAVFGTSWQQLAPGAQAVLAQLSVFHGGFTVPAAEAVVLRPGNGGAPASTIRDTLALLVEKSLLQYDRAVQRYQIHDLLRQFCC